MKNNKKLVFSLFMALSSTYVFTAEKNLNDQDITHIKKIIAPLARQEMKLLNSVLTTKPFVVVRIDLARKSIKKVLSEMKKNEDQRTTSSSFDEKNFITKNLDEILKPVETFFETLRQYRKLLRPLIEESVNKKKSLLLDLCNSKDTITIFCTKKIVTITLFKSICEELLAFFTKIKASLSPKAHEAYQTLIKELKKKKTSIIQ